MRRRTARQITALADGSLPQERREPLVRQIERSPALERAFENQRFALEAIRGLAVVRAPEALRAWVERASRRGAPGCPGAPR